MSASPMPFLTAQSANAIVSDLRPTTLAPRTLHHINLFLDEILSSMITSAESINPSDLRVVGIPAVFSGDKSAGESTGPRSLGRAAVSEAEMELRSWYEQNSDGRGGSKKGFPPGGKGTGVIDTRTDGRFPTHEAIRLLRLKCASFSTLAPETPYTPEDEETVMTAWKAAGGDTSAETIDPAGLWMTAIIEHVCEHVLQQLSSVVARDSSAAVAGVQDLLTTLYEDETMYGFFKRMKVKDTLEQAIKSNTPRSKRSHPSPNDKSMLGRISGSPQASKTSLVSLTGINRENAGSPASKKSSNGPGGSPADRFGPMAGIGRKMSSAKKAPSAYHEHKASKGSSAGSHERTPSILSINTRSMLGAFNEHFEDGEGSEDSRGRSPQQEADEFDALLRGGETMKVSLTPSRLKTFEIPGGKKGSPQQKPFVRQHRSTSGGATSLPGSANLPNSESLPAIPKHISPQRPSHNIRQSGSAPRLVARGATTIQEGTDEEEDPLGRSKPRKETLKELLGEEPDTSSTSSTGPVPRTAPAVVLATPPSAFTAAEPITYPTNSALNDETTTQASNRPNGSRRSSPTKPSINRPDREIVMEEEDDKTLGSTRPSARRKKSEAQELADFLTNTPPPVTTARMPVSEPPPSAKSNRSFKSFINKMKRNKNDDDRSVHSPTPVDAPIAGQIPASVRRVQSTGLQHHTGIRTPPNTDLQARQLPIRTSSSNRDANAVPAAQAVPTSPPNVLRKKSDSGMSKSHVVSASLGAAAGLVGAGVAVHHFGKEKENQPPLPDNNIDQPRRPSKDTKTGSARSSPKVEGGEPTSSATVRGRTSVSEHSFKTAEEEQEPVPPKPVPDSEESTSADVPRNEAQSRSRAASFVNTTKATKSQHEHSASTDTTKTPKTPPAQPPSIPLADLVPLRNLLQHATSANECRMLLSAVLTQLGVPTSSAQTREQEITPESMVTAWLLAGNFGPIDTLPSLSTSSLLDPSQPRETEKVAEEEISIPENEEGVKGPTSAIKEDEVEGMK